MNENPEPVLAQFGVPPRGISDWLRLERDRATSLLREPGAEVPLVEELIALGNAGREDGRLATLLTETHDQPDPDLLRGESLQRWVGAAVTTFFTKIDGDPADPDLVRAEVARRALAQVESVLTRNYPDPPDPDLVRIESTRRDRAFET